MRNLDEIMEFLEERDFLYEEHAFGQSYRHRGVLFFWKRSESQERPETFRPEIRGKARGRGGRIYDLVRLLPPTEDEVWKFEPYWSTRKFQDEMIWEGRSFRDWSGIKIVRLPEIKDDLEELIKED